MTALAWATAGSGIDTIRFLPCRLTPDGLVHPLKLGSPESNEVVAYVEQCNRTQRLNGRIVAVGAVSLASFETTRVIPA